MAANGPFVVSASSVKSATGNSGPIGGSGVSGPLLPDKGDQLAILVNATAINGTPSFVHSVEWSMDDGATFAQGDPADTMTAITAVSARVKSFTMKSNCFRVVWTLTSTVSLTFEVRAYIFGSP